MITPGESLDGYSIIRQIGSGGFGEVWLCKSEALRDFRALKYVPATDPARLKKEFDALCRYRTAAGQLRSPSIMPIEHVNLGNDGLFYIMPLADGYGSDDPQSQEWHPSTLAAVIEGSRGKPTWLTSGEIKGCITPILDALQLLSNAKLVHRDVKPENILFWNGTPCLGDISLLGEDSLNISRPGTPGYSAPSWFVESGGHPDMYGVATTLYTLMTGNPPDKMARNAFLWPPQGEESLPPEDRREWLRLHQVIRRAVDERPAERFADFLSFARALEVADEYHPGKHPKKTMLLASLVVVAIICLAGLSLWLGHGFRQQAGHSGTNPPTPVQSGTPRQEMKIPENIPEVYRADMDEFETALNAAKKDLTYPPSPRKLITDPVEQAIRDLEKIGSHLSLKDVAQRVTEIQKKFASATEYVPERPGDSGIIGTVEPLRALANRIKTTARTQEQQQQYESIISPLIEGQIRDLENEARDEFRFRRELMDKLSTAIDPIFQRFLAPQEYTRQKSFDDMIAEASSEDARLRTELRKSIQAMISGAGKVGI